MNEITVEELKAAMDAGKEFLLVDVREPFEHELSNLGGLNIPLGNITLEADSIPTDIPVYMLCRVGRRSAAAIGQLEPLGYDNLYNITGGITEWKNKFAPDMPVY